MYICVCSMLWSGHIGWHLETRTPHVHCKRCRAVHWHTDEHRASQSKHSAEKHCTKTKTEKQVSRRTRRWRHHPNQSYAKLILDRIDSLTTRFCEYVLLSTKAGLVFDFELFAKGWTQLNSTQLGRLEWLWWNWRNVSF